MKLINRFVFPRMNLLTCAGRTCSGIATGVLWIWTWDLADWIFLSGSNFPVLQQDLLLPIPPVRTPVCLWSTLPVELRMESFPFRMHFSCPAASIPPPNPLDPHTCTAPCGFPLLNLQFKTVKMDSYGAYLKINLK